MKTKNTKSAIEKAGRARYERNIERAQKVVAEYTNLKQEERLEFAEELLKVLSLDGYKPKCID